MGIKTFEAHGYTWVCHEPGDPMPCDIERMIAALRSDGVILGKGGNYDYVRHGSDIFWGRSDIGFSFDVIGWRYADAEPVGDGIADDTAALKKIIENSLISNIDADFLVGEFEKRMEASVGTWRGHVFPERSQNDEMICADIPLVEIDDSSLSPSQRRHWDAMEAKQAAREQLQRDSESKVLQERADSLAEAGRAMDMVNQDHGHKLGWLA